MDNNEIKKLLYKAKFMAELQNVRRDGILYTTTIIETQGYTNKAEFKINFLIPLAEVGEVIWKAEMEAKLLIRWLQD